MTRPRLRRAFTLIEVLVVVSVIGVLAALLIPAVQAARDAARRAHCLNNLKNIGLGVHNHVEAHGKFPSGGHGSRVNSFFVQILPYIEQAALHDSINMGPMVPGAANTTAERNPPALYLCPSDASRAVPWAVNYAANQGRWKAGEGSNDGDGVFTGKPLSPRDVTDGLSSTAGVSEWVTGPWNASEKRESTSKYRLKRIYSDPESDLDAFVRDCTDLVDVDPAFIYGSKGLDWTWGPVLGSTTYNHTMLPGGHSCEAPGPMDASTAGSFHGVVNVLIMDGGVRAVKATAAPAAWRAMGTRAGGEPPAAVD